MLLNKGSSSQAGFNFDVIQLPAAFQWMPLFSFVQMNDKSIIAGGNFYGVLPYEGRYDNAMLPMMAFNQNTLKQTGSLFAEGEVRNMQWINLAGNKKALVIARNNLPLMILELN